MADDERADILLVTVTKVETRAVLEAFKAAGSRGQRAKPRSIDGRVYFNLGTVNGARVRMTQSEMGAGGLGGSMHAVGKGIAALSPAAVIMVGIAFGMSEDKQAIGDVLVAEQLRPYELQRVGTGDGGSLKLLLRDDRPHSSPWLLNLLKSSEVTWEGATLRFGTILTGGKLVDHLGFRGQLHTLEPEAIGGEMEGAGLYVACQDQKVDWILVKAICDFADGNKAKDKMQRQSLAAQNAAAVVHHALRFVKIDWNTHRGAIRASLPLAVQAHDPEAATELLRSKSSKGARTRSSPVLAGSDRMRGATRVSTKAGAKSPGTATHPSVPNSGDTKLLPVPDRALSHQYEKLNQLALIFEGKSESDLRDEASTQLLIESNWLRAIDDYAYIVFRMTSQPPVAMPHESFQRRIISEEAFLRQFRPMNDLVRSDVTDDFSDYRSSPWSEYDFFEICIPDSLVELTDKLKRLAESHFMPEECVPLIQAYIAALNENVHNIWDLLREAVAEFASAYPTPDALRQATPDSVLFRSNSRLRRLKDPADSIIKYVRRFMTVNVLRHRR